VSRQRFPPPSDPEIAVAQRLKQVRTEYRLTRREVADRIGMTPDSLNRVERGKVALRFGPGWKFCEVTRTNPVWLAFGDQHPRIGFAPFARIDSEEKSVPFFSTMLGWARTYEEHRKKSFKITPPQEAAFAQSRSKIKTLVEVGVKRYLTDVTVPTWRELRSRLKAAAGEPGARATLARSLGVTPAAVSQWLSGANAPKADTTLRLLQWVFGAEAKQKFAPEVDSARPARLKAQNGKQQHGKPKSSRRKV
jgi:transcriptional regulator with XRE-family HTH domain